LHGCWIGFAELGEEIIDVISEPTDEGTIGYEFYLSDESPLVLVAVEYDLDEVIDDDLEQFEELGWKANGVSNYGDPYYLSPNEQILVSICGMSGYIVIAFALYVAPSTEWPGEEIEEVLSELKHHYQLTKD